MEGFVRLQRQLEAAVRSRLAGGNAPIPEAGVLFFNMFAALAATRGGSQPLSHAEIEAYIRLYRWPLEPRHVDLLRSLDRVWLEHASKAVRGATTPTPPTKASPMTAAAFDAVFS